MIKIFPICLILLFPNNTFAAKPEDLTIRVGATIVMVILVTGIAALWNIIRHRLEERNTNSTHRTHMSQQSIPDYSRLTKNSNSPVHRTTGRTETPNACTSNGSQRQVSRNALSLKEAFLGHWVSYIDFRTSYEKLTRSNHYVATHRYIDENNLKIIQVEIKGTKEVTKEAKTFVYKILEIDNKKNMIRVEMFDHPQKVSYSQATYKFSNDRRKMVDKIVLPKIDSSPGEWIYVDSVKNI